MTAWSYSSIKTFDQCPKKYFHLKVVKDVKDTPGEAADYGTAVHEAAELFIKDGTPIPAKFGYMKPIVESLAGIEGEKYTELKLGVTKTDTGYEPCSFFAKDVWWRGIVDLVIINGHKAYMVDYKTGKSAKYADTKQLDLMAGALFVHYPGLKVIKSALAYVVSNEFIRKVHVREEMDTYLTVFADELGRLEHAELSGVWNPKSGPLCGWCPVVECEHHRPRRR
jgi:CRISPR/Cas system-associated exonuclease Cas4 (RecB family)